MYKNCFNPYLNLHCFISSKRRFLPVDFGEISKNKKWEALKDLKLLNLAANSITEIGGLDTLTNLEELHLESNNIENIKGLDSLINLRTLRLNGNRIAKVESFQNKEKLTHLFLDKNPLYVRIKHVFSSTNPQNLKFFIQMSDKEIRDEGKRIAEKIDEERRKTEKARRKQLIRQVAPLEHEAPARIPAKTSYAPQPTTYKKSTFSGGDTTLMLQIIFGVIGVILFISGIILTFFDLGLSGLVVTIFDAVLTVTPLGITFLVIGFLLVVIVSSGSCIEGCIPT